MQKRGDGLDGSMTGTDQVRLVKCTTAGAYSSTLNCTGLAVNGSTATVRGGCLVADALNASAPTYWIAIGGAFSGVYGFAASTGANTANRDFGLAGEVAGGVAWDGSAFRGWAAAAPTSVWAFTSWDWSSATQPFWLAHSWYDDVGAVHETRVGPRASIGLGRRRQLGVTLPAVPTGGADDPDKLNLYMLASAADPGAGSGTMKLQATTTATQLTLTSYSAAGAADPASNNFPGGTPALIKSQVSGWTLRGDGRASVRGWGFKRSGSATTVTTGQNLDFSTAAQDSHPAQYDGTNKRWTVPAGGAGVWALTATAVGTVSGTVSVTRGGITVNGTVVGGLYIWPLGGTNVGASAACVLPLADGDTIAVSLSIVNGTSASMSLTAISAVRLPIDAFAA